MSKNKDPLENKVKKNNKLITVDLQQFHDGSEVMELDIKDFLYEELLLKEQDFRDYLENHDWSQYQDAYLATYCSTDAIIAHWAFMLVAQHAAPYAKDVIVGSREDAYYEIFRKNLANHDWSQYQDKRVLFKGCSDVTVPESVYVLATNHVLPYADRIMYGEACSFVPVYRKPKQSKKSSSSQSKTSTTKASA